MQLFVKLNFFSTKDQGMGFGLSIARSIVEALQERIWAENNSSGGTTFHFTVKRLIIRRNLHKDI